MPAHQGFDPVVGEQPHVLILGTFPGLASREKAEYYGHPRNQFWPLIYTLFGQSYSAQPYPKKLHFLREHHIALWDIVSSCDTNGSADTEIRGAVLIDLPNFLATYPSIRLICFNGSASARYAKRMRKLPVPGITLLSSSPANARYSFDEKLTAWRQALAPVLGDK